jgi:hypothetical protein
LLPEALQRRSPRLAKEVAEALLAHADRRRRLRIYNPGYSFPEDFDTNRLATVLRPLFVPGRGKRKPKPLVSDSHRATVHADLKTTIKKLRAWEKTGKTEDAARHLVRNWWTRGVPVNSEQAAEAVRYLATGTQQARWKYLLDAVIFHLVADEPSAAARQGLIDALESSVPPAEVSLEIIATLSGVEPRTLRNRLSGHLRPRANQ